MVDAVNLPGFDTIDEKITALKHGLLERPRCWCGQYVSCSNGVIRRYCSINHAISDPSTMERRKAKWMESGAAKKIAETVKQRYGAEGMRERRKLGVKAKYGVENTFMAKEV
jgi:hypothetical protein